MDVVASRHRQSLGETRFVEGNIHLKNVCNFHSENCHSLTTVTIEKKVTTILKECTEETKTEKKMI